MNYELKRVGVWSVAKISFVLGAILGFVAGLFLWMVMSVMQALPIEDMAGMEGMGALGAMGVMMPFFLAVFYGVASMIVNSIMAGVYNLLSGFLGGLELTLAANVPAPSYAPYAAPPPPPAPPTWAPPPSPPAAQGPASPPAG
jgi:hypothetical protein